MDNNLRTLANVVALDGWIGDLDEHGHASVDIDIVFREAQFGGVPSDKIRFKIMLKRAEVLLHVPDGEPLRIVKRTVARSSPDITGEKTTTKKASGSAAAAGEAKASSSDLPSVNFNATVETDIEHSVETRTREALGRFAVQHFTEGASIGWEISGIDSRSILGSPWDAQNEPRLKVKKTSSVNRDNDKPSMRIEVRCRRSDMQIEGLEIKDQAKWRLFQRNP